MLEQFLALVVFAACAVACLTVGVAVAYVLLLPVRCLVEWLLDRLL